jgi:glycine cleavage system H protein
MADLKYTKEHAWVREEGDEMICGITAYAADKMGDIIFVELPDEGADVSAGDAYGSVESAKAVEDMISPVTGSIARVNEELMDAPEILNEDATGEGWTIAVTGGELGDTMDEAEYNAFLENLD